MAEGQLFTMAVWMVRKGREEELIDSWKALAQRTKDSYEGAVGAYMVRDREDPQRLVTFGLWTSEEDIRRWRESADFKGFFARASTMCEDIQWFTGEEVAHVGGELVVA